MPAGKESTRNVKRQSTGMLIQGEWEDINWSHIPSSVYKKYSVKWIN